MNQELIDLIDNVYNAEKKASTLRSALSYLFGDAASLVDLEHRKAIADLEVCKLKLFEFKKNYAGVLVPGKYFIHFEWSDRSQNLFLFYVITKHSTERMLNGQGMDEKDPSYNESEFSAVLDSLNCFKVRRWSWAFKEDITIEEARKKLIGLGFCEDPRTMTDDWLNDNMTYDEAKEGWEGTFSKW